MKRTRLQMLAAAKKQQFNNPGYRKRRNLKPILTSTQGGVAGGRARMRAGHLAPPPEVKFFDLPIGGTTLSSWTLVNTDSIFSIVQGTGANDRIGRKIRVKGIVFRLMINQAVGATGQEQPSPWTMDVLWDNQANGALPTAADIYTTPNNGLSLPNPLFDERFTFVRRLSNNDPSAVLNIINGSLKCDKVITYDKNTGSITDLSSTNLLMTFCTPGDAASQLTGNVRVLYVDA